MGLQANPGPPFDGRETRPTNPQQPAPNPKNYQAGATALQTGMPVFRSAPTAKVVVATGKDGCRSTQANPHWVRASLYPSGGPVANYLTLVGNQREVELGAFLVPEERQEIHDRLQLLLAAQHRLAP